MAKTCGSLIMGGPGCGKTSFCCEVVWPTSNHGRQVALSKRVLAHYFCQAHDIETLSITNFMHSLIEQLSKTSLISGYEEQLQDASVRAALDPMECEKHPDEAFKKGVLLPLLALAPPAQNVFILVDSVDESYMQTLNERVHSSRTIAELLANHHQLFPQWLLLVCTARKQSKLVTKLFTGFRKIGLDDLRKSHVVRDVQQYILCRLDQEERLRQHLSRETAEMLNQLHIKSNGCFLYLEKVLDGVAENFILLREIREIPGTLNGLYLWLCQRLFVKKSFGKVQPVLNVILAARRPLTEMELYSCVYTRNGSLTFEEFKARLQLLAKILTDGRDETKILFHHSFAEWLLDVKHCTQKYLCTAADGHGMLAMSFTMHASSLTPMEIQDFGLHLVKGNLGAPLEMYHLSLWLVHCGAKVEDSLSAAMPKDPTVLKLLRSAGASMPVQKRQGSSHTPTQLGGESSLSLVASLDQSPGRGGEQLQLHKEAHEGNLQSVLMLLNTGADPEAQDSLGQTALNLAARQGHAEVVEAFIKSNADVNHSDKEGWTALRSAAWGGHSDVVGALLEGKAYVDQADGDQRTALRAAAWGGHDDIVMKLLEHNANVNKVDNEGRTALIAAAYMGHAEIVEHLLDNGANINHQDIDGRTALSVAALCIPASEGHSTVASLLLDRGIEVDHEDKDGMTPLIVAAYEGHQEVCELLLENDADVDHADHNNRTPLQAAASMGHASIVNLLLFWGAAVDTIDSDGRTVLCIAAQQGNADVARQLLDRGLDEMHRDNAGWTPLHMAAFEGHKEVMFFHAEVFKNFMPLLEI